MSGPENHVAFDNTSSTKLPNVPHSTADW